MNRRLLLALLLPAAVLLVLLARAFGDRHEISTGVRSNIADPHSTAPAADPSAHPKARGSGHPAVSWVDRRRLAASMRRIADATGAEVGAAIQPLDGRPAVRFGPLQTGAAWSTMKVPVILSRYRLARELGQPFTQLKGRVVSAVTESDNEAAESLFDEIANAEGGMVPASRYVQHALEEGGDDWTVVNTTPPPDGFSTFGQTQWGLAPGLRFYSSLARGCLAPTGAGRTIVDLMGEVVPSQSWGLGQIHFRGADRVLFKGGWGPDPAGRYLVRQFGIVQTAGGGGVVVGLADMPADGSFESGVFVLDRVAAAVAGSIDLLRARGRQACRP